MTRSWTLAAVAAALLPWNAGAENAFRVSRETTGLEGPAQAAAPLEEKAAPGAPAAKADHKEPMEIRASKQTEFDEETRTAVFLGEVTIKDPQFNVSCDKLTAVFKKIGQPEKAAPAYKAPEGGERKDAEKKPAEKKEGGAGGLKSVTAEGNVVFTQDKVDEKSGEVTRSVGKAAKAEYDAASGNLVLSGWPQIQQGSNTQVATSEKTIMTMNRDGRRMKTEGPCTTIIQEKPENDAKAAKNPHPEHKSL